MGVEERKGHVFGGGRGEAYKTITVKFKGTFRRQCPTFSLW